MKKEQYHIPKEFLAEQQQYIPGIYGGVGPLSHTQFEQEVLAANYRRRKEKDLTTPDQAHPVWMLVNGSATPDRTKYLLDHTQKPVAPHMLAYAKYLEGAGADFMVVICNTSHAFHEEVQSAIGIPWIHMMRITAERISKNMPKVKNVGIIGTDGTVQFRLYHDALEAFGITPIAPTVGSGTQKMIMHAIYGEEYGVKNTGGTVDPRAVKDFCSAASWCIDNGAQAVIAACTEVSVGLAQTQSVPVLVIDPLKDLAEVFLDITFGMQQPSEFLISYPAK